MENFVWSPALDVGNEKLNHEHQHLIQEMADIHELSKNLAPRNKVLARYRRLIDLVGIHFSDEETYMRNMEYPGVDSHRLLHDQLISTLRRFANEYEHSTDPSLPVSVPDFFNMWLTTHIMIADRKYADFENSRKSVTSQARELERKSV